MKLKKIFLIGLALLFVTSVFGQTYEEYLAKAKQYETEKSWCYALGAYYDAMGTDLAPEQKQEAYDGYIKLRNAILSGQPGLGKFNVFTLHDEWKKLLMDAEKFGSSYNPYILTVGDLVQGKLNYENKTASYSAPISFYRSGKYDYTIDIVAKGFRAAYSIDWTDMPWHSEWPFLSVSYRENNKYNNNGALTFSRYSYNVQTGERGNLYMNAFSYSGLDVEDLYYKQGWYLDYTPNLFDYKFNIVDENGKELVKGKRWLLGESDEITFTDIPISVMELIDSGNAYVNPVACYLQYGEYNKNDDTGGRSFIKNFPEVELPINKTDYICWNNLENEINMTVRTCMMENYDLGLVKIPGLNIEMGKTEVTQDLYQLFVGENPSYNTKLLSPVSNVHLYNVIEFCNHLSIFYGFDCVYSVDGEIDSGKWKYRNGSRIKDTLLGELSIDTSANGFRLPTLEEWLYAAKGGEDYIYAGSSNVDDVAWVKENSGNGYYPVAQKKANAYGLFDMCGNIQEWTSTLKEKDSYYVCGGSYNDEQESSRIESEETFSPSACQNNLGFRLVRTVTE